MLVYCCATWGSATGPVATVPTVPTVRQQLEGSQAREAKLTAALEDERAENEALVSKIAELESRQVIDIKVAKDGSG